MPPLDKIPAKLGKFRISYEFLIQGLNIPETARIITVQPDPDGTSFTVVLMDPGLEEIKEGHLIPEYTPMMTRETHDCGHETIVWEWREPLE